MRRCCAGALPRRPAAAATLPRRRACPAPSARRRRRPSPHLVAVNATQPGYSAIAAAAVSFADEALPKSAKGNVVRSLVEKKYRPQMVELQAPAGGGDDDDSDGDGGEEEAADSIALVASKRRPKKARPPPTAAAARAARAHMYFFAMLHVLLHHNEVLYGGGPLCSSSPACNPVPPPSTTCSTRRCPPSCCWPEGYRGGRGVAAPADRRAARRRSSSAWPDLAHCFCMAQWSASAAVLLAAATAAVRWGAARRAIHVHLPVALLRPRRVQARRRRARRFGQVQSARDRRRRSSSTSLVCRRAVAADAQPGQLPPQSNLMYEAEASLLVMAKFAPPGPSTPRCRCCSPPTSRWSSRSSGGAQRRESRCGQGPRLLASRSRSRSADGHPQPGSDEFDDGRVRLQGGALTRQRRQLRRRPAGDARRLGHDAPPRAHFGGGGRLWRLHAADADGAPRRRRRDAFAICCSRSRRRSRARSRAFERRRPTRARRGARRRAAAALAVQIALSRKPR